MIGKGAGQRICVKRVGQRSCKHEWGQSWRKEQYIAAEERICKQELGQYRDKGAVYRSGDIIERKELPYRTLFGRTLNGRTFVACRGAGKW